MSDEVAVLEVSGKDFTGWSALTIQGGLNSIVDSFSFSVPFDSDRPDLREAFRPFGYQLVQVKVDDELLSTGRAEFPSTSIGADGRVINVQGRSFAGSMIDCPFEPPYQFDRQTWVAIAKKIAAPFSVPIDTTVDTGPIQEARANSGDKGADFLLRLAAGEGYLLNSSPAGAMRLQKITKKAPVASIVEGVGSFVSATLAADGTKRHSQIKAIKDMGGFKDVTATSRDSALKVYRPSIITTAGSPGATQKAADFAMSQTIVNAIQFDVTVTGWKTDAGLVWTPGQFVTLYAPSAWVMRETLLIVAGRSLELTEAGRITSLQLTLPEAYLGGIPGSYPWD